tara:strand:+ start:620 stop:1069 length:450 start_codon:yes stop_codon:yes gene_type:complete
LLIKHEEKGLFWQTMEGYILHTSQMKTSHLFNSVKMIYNHMAQLIGFPTFWFNKEYEKWNEIWINEPEQTLESLKIMIEELETRTDWDENQKSTYMSIRLTLSGGFHKILFDELEKRGFDRDLIQIQEPIKLLMEAKEKYERKQLTNGD